MLHPSFSGAHTDIIRDNIAYLKPATQSGVWQNYVAKRAVDGYTNQDVDYGYCAHPSGQSGQGSWWTVDLSNNDPTITFVIQNVTIYFRDAHQCKYELSTLVLLLPSV